MRENRPLDRCPSALTSGLCSLLVLVLACFLSACEEDQATTPAPRFSESGGDTFAVGDTVSVLVESFAGAIEMDPGGSNSVELSFTKWAAREIDLAKIVVSATQVNDEIEIVTSEPPGLSNTAVDLSVVAPPSTQLVIRLGAGTIRSSIRPRGTCRFQVGAGSIVLQLDGDIGVTVHLFAVAGTVSVDFPVDGTVSQKAVEGTIGAGDEADIWAQVAAGDIRVIRRTRPR